MKYEWRKQDKALYLPKSSPTILSIPKMKFLSIRGEGNPNSIGFQEKVSALYALSYGLKMTLKKRLDVPEYFDYTVFPLEGLWGMNDDGKRLYHAGAKAIELKDYFTFKVMIRQPDFITQSLFQEIQKTVYKKNQNEFVNQVILEEIEEGLVCQMLHIGSYDDEPVSFAQMETYVQQQGYQRQSKDHKEIYISDPQKVAPDKLKTTLRFTIFK